MTSLVLHETIAPASYFVGRGEDRVAIHLGPDVFILEPDKKMVSFTTWGRCPHHIPRHVFKAIKKRVPCREVDVFQVTCRYDTVTFLTINGLPHESRIPPRLFDDTVQKAFVPVGYRHVPRDLVLAFVEWLQSETLPMLNLRGGNDLRIHAWEFLRIAGFDKVIEDVQLLYALNTVDHLIERAPCRINPMDWRTVRGREIR